LKGGLCVTDLDDAVDVLDGAAQQGSTDDAVGNLT
jgi:hypothetical protein